MNQLAAVKKALRAQGDPKKAVFLQRFFKTGPGEYAAEDKLLGVTVPAQRVIAKQFADLPLHDVVTLLHSPYHEDRLTALLIMVRQFERSRDAKHRAQIYTAYLKNTKWINNWDLVDSSAAQIIGAFLGDASIPVQKKLARSSLIWDRRIGMISTLYAIRRGNPQPTLQIAAMLLTDTHDLIHKAAGWMLREMGKSCGEKFLVTFLHAHASKMPRTMLRYAIEKFPEKKRRAYLSIALDV